jgi:hypothetical protein
MEDIYSEIDATETVISGEATYTLTDTDYDDLDLGYGNFSSIEDAKSMLPDFLSGKFPAWGAESLAAVTFKLYSPIKFETYTVTDADYTAVGLTSLNNSGDFNDFFSYKFPSEANGTVVDLTYNTEPTIINYTLTDADFDLVGNGNYNNFDIRAGKDEETIESRRIKIETILLNNVPDAVAGDLFNVTYAIYNGAAGTRDMLVEFDGTGYTIFSTTSYEFYTFVLEENTARFTYSDEWAAPITFTSDEYSLMGQRYPNFSDNDEAVYNIGIYLRTLYQFAAPDDFVAVEYNYYSGGISQRNVNFVFDGSVWNAIPTVIDETIKFGHDGATWVPDNTIKYTLTGADYTLVGNGNYGNFDVRAGKDEEQESVRLDKINTILLNNFPSDAEGQKYIVTYNIYNGANGVWSFAVIKEGGAYIKQ